MQQADAIGAYREDEPIPGVDETLSNCFPTSGLIHRTMHYLVQTGYTSPFHHLAALLPFVANTMALRGWNGVGRGSQIAIQTCLIGPSGAAKSTAIREVMRLSAEVTRAYFGPSYNPEKHDRWVPCEGTMPGILETLHDMKLESWDTPIMSHRLDTTPCILYSEELPVGLLNKQESLKVLLELFDPVPKVDRRLAKYRAMKKQGQEAPSCVERPAISAVFATTPASIQAAFESHHLDGGFAQRIVWAFARGDMARLSIDTPDRTDARRGVVGYWVEALRWHDTMSLRSEAAGRLLPLTASVKASLEQTLAEIQEAYDSGDDRAVAMKVRSLNFAQLVAQVFAWSRGAYEVHPADLERAMNFISMSHESFSNVSNFVDPESSWSRQRMLLEAIEKAGKTGLTKSECYKILRCSKGDLESTLDALKDRHTIDSVKNATTGRPVERFVAKKVQTTETTGVVLPFVRPDAKT